MPDLEFQRALQLFQSGDLLQAKVILQKLIQTHKDFPYAYNLVGVIAFQENHYQEAEQFFQKAIALNREAFDFYLNLGHLYMTQQKISEGIPLLKKSLELNPQQSAICQQIIEYYISVQDFEQAERYLKEFLKSQPYSPQALSALLEILIHQDRLEEAYEYLEKLPLQLQSLAFWEIYASKALDTRHFSLAIRAFEKMLMISPSNAVLHNNLGSIYSQQGQDLKALECFEQALIIHPEYAESHLNRAYTLYSLADDSMNIFESLQKALKYQPDLEEAIFNFSQKLNQNSSLYLLILQELADNSQSFRIQSLSCLAYMSDGKAASFYYEKVLELEPDNYWYEIKLATLVPPFLYKSEDVHHLRHKIRDSLEHLLMKYRTQQLNLLNSAVTHFKLDAFMFYLAYQGMNDKELNQILGQIWYEIYAQYIPELTPEVKTKAEPIRIGFVSQHFKDHSVMHCYWTLIEELALRADFEVICLTFDIGQEADEMTAQIQSIVQDFIILNFESRFYETILKQDLDILIYTDVGMDLASFISAQLRLAPIQCVLPGHPVTTGSLNMDYFISKYYEIPNAQAHYSETLICLNSLGLNYKKPCLPERFLTRQELDLPIDNNIYFCPMMLFKIHFEFDLLIREILLKDPRGIVIFVDDYKGRAKCLKDRFYENIPEVLSQIQWLPRLPFETFLQVIYCSDIVLDTIHFGGGNTSRQTLAVGTPMMTLPSNFLRSRITYGLYLAMDIMDCVAKDQNDYVNKAVKIATDKEYQQYLREQILQQNHILFEQQGSYDELISFLQQVVYNKHNENYN